MLDKLRVEFTTSQPRRSNDNGLAQTKNGAVVRKHLGYIHLPQRFASEVKACCTESLNPYRNFPRPCLFAADITDKKGKIRERYPQHRVMTPFEKLTGSEDGAAFRKPDIPLESLRAEAARHSDNDATARLSQARQQLVLSLHKRSRSVA